MTDYETIHLDRCVRCGEEHDIDIEKFKSAPPKYTHWSMCPSLGEPILIRFTGNDESSVSEKTDINDRLKAWLESFLSGNPYPDTVIEWDHYDKKTKQLFVNVFGEWDSEIWGDLDDNIGQEFEGVLIGVMKV